MYIHILGKICLINPSTFIFGLKNIVLYINTYTKVAADLIGRSSPGIPCPRFYDYCGEPDSQDPIFTQVVFYWGETDK